MLRTCDSCGQNLVRPGERDMFFVVRLQITKGVSWGPDQTAARERMVQESRRSGMNSLANALDACEPADIVGDRIQSLTTRADLRICAECVEHGPTSFRADGGKAGIDVLALVRASEVGGPRVSPPETA